MLHISVAELLVDRLSTPHADMPVKDDLTPKPIGGRLGRLWGLFQGRPQTMPTLDAPLVQP